VISHCYRSHDTRSVLFPVLTVLLQPLTFEEKAELEFVETMEPPALVSSWREAGYQAVTRPDAVGYVGWHALQKCPSITAILIYTMLPPQISARHPRWTDRRKQGWSTWFTSFLPWSKNEDETKDEYEYAEVDDPVRCVYYT